MAERGEVIVEAEEVAKDEGACSLCGCPLRLHAKIGEWCARCAKPCPPRQAEPVGTKQRVLEALRAYSSRQSRSQTRCAS